MRHNTHDRWHVTCDLFCINAKVQRFHVSRCKIFTLLYSVGACSTILCSTIHWRCKKPLIFPLLSSLLGQLLVSGLTASPVPTADEGGMAPAYRPLDIGSKLKVVKILVIKDCSNLFGWVRGCSHMTSAKKWGVQTPLLPCRTKFQKLAPPHPLHFFWSQYIIIN